MSWEQNKANYHLDLISLNAPLYVQEIYIFYFRNLGSVKNGIFKKRAALLQRAVV